MLRKRYLAINEKPETLVINLDEPGKPEEARKAIEAAGNLIMYSMNRDWKWVRDNVKVDTSSGTTLLVTVYTRRSPAPIDPLIAFAGALYGLNTPHFKRVLPNPPPTSAHGTLLKLTWRGSIMNKEVMNASPAADSKGLLATSE